MPLIIIVIIVNLSYALYLLKLSYAFNNSEILTSNTLYSSGFEFINLQELNEIQ